jgi:hypothetical protein
VDLIGLYGLVPVLWRILRPGPGHPDSLDRLWAHWGITGPPRRAGELAVPSAEAAALPAGTAPLRYLFWTAGLAPWPALDRISQDWPTLAMRLTCAAAWPDPAISSRVMGAAQGSQDPGRHSTTAITALATD